MQYTDAMLSVTPAGAPIFFSIYRGLGASRLAFARLLRPHGSSADALLPPASVLTPLPGLIFRSPAARPIPICPSPPMRITHRSLIAAAIIIPTHNQLNYQCDFPERGAWPVICQLLAERVLVSEWNAVPPLHILLRLIPGCVIPPFAASAA